MINCHEIRCDTQETEKAFEILQSVTTLGNPVKIKKTLILLQNVCFYEIFLLNNQHNEKMEMMKE